MNVNKEDKELETPLSIIQCNTTFNCDHIIEFTHFRQCQQKLNTINFVKKVKFMAELLF